MQTTGKFLGMLWFICISLQPVFSQQHTVTGTEEEMPLKTVVLKETGETSIAGFFEGKTVLKFSVHKLGSVQDVTHVLKTFRRIEGVKNIKEGELAGDLKEFELTVKEPKNKAWFKNAFTQAGFTHFKFNNSKVQPLKEL